jgi:hypothetical protein
VAAAASTPYSMQVSSPKIKQISVKQQIGTLLIGADFMIPIKGAALNRNEVRCPTSRIFIPSSSLLLSLFFLNAKIQTVQDTVYPIKTSIFKQY